jgi:hypothetical protein
MNDSNPQSSSSTGLDRQAWNKGKHTGPKPPLRPGHVWLIRAKLQLKRRARDLALFNLAIDSKLRGCDLVALRVDDVAPNGTPSIVQASARGRPVGRFGSSSPSRRDSHSMTTFGPAGGRPVNACSLAVAGHISP